MKRIYLLAAGLSASLIASAQVTLPRSTFSLDFEGVTNVAEFNGTQVGDGELRTSDDANFGTYYQNCPNSATTTKATNYLRVELGDGLTKAAEKTTDGAVSIGFWVNPTVANLNFPDISYYYSVFYTIYNAGNRGLGASDNWGNTMWSQNARGWAQINDWAGHWDDFKAEENINGANQESISYLAQKTKEVTSTNEDGEEVVENIPTGFDDNWHYIAFVLNKTDNTATIYADGAVYNQWTCQDGFLNGSTSLFDGFSNYADLYLGGVAQWTWADPDPAFAYDDFTIFAGNLGIEQQELVMKIKRGEVDDDTRLAIAKNDYYEAVSELEDFLGRLEEYATLTLNMENVLVETEEQTEANPTAETYTSAATTIRTKITEQEKIVNAADAVKETIANEQAYAEATNYPGKSAYVEALSQCSSKISDASTMETSSEVAAEITKAKGSYVTSQELPADGSGVDVTALILHPWFCNPDAEPTQNEDGTYTFPYVTDHNYASNSTPSDYNSTGWVNGNSFIVDDARVNWTEGRITWNNWHAKTTVGTLDIHQDLTGLPEGYYSVSADWITNYEPSTQHTYAKSGNVTKSSVYLDNQGWDSETWTTLSTDKILIGSDGTLTIGGTSTTTGAAYSGWFCVTNFKLTYYGTNVDLSEDLTTKRGDVENAISELILQGDIDAANKQLNDIMSNPDSYTAIDDLTKMIAELNNTLAKEQVIVNAVDEYSTQTSASANETTVLNAVKSRLSNMINASDATIEIQDEVNTMISGSNSYISAIAAAENWNTTETTSLLNKQMEAIKSTDASAGPTAESLAANVSALVGAMKASLPEKDASESSPLDITAFLQNPSFTGDSMEGWTIATGTAACYYSELEFYNTNFNIYQVVSDMPEGYYRFACQGYYRDGANADVYNKSLAVDEEGNAAPTNVLNAKLYAQNWTSDIQSWAQFYTLGEEFTGYYSPNINDESIDAGQVLYFADTMEGANYLFDTKKMNEDGNSVDFHISAGSMKLGIKKETTISGDWTIFDNFHLYYLGQTKPEGFVDAAKPGDVNEDGAVDISDIVAVINQIAGTATYENADVNSDTKVDISDIVAIINIIAQN